MPSSRILIRSSLSRLQLFILPSSLSSLHLYRADFGRCEPLGLPPQHAFLNRTLLASASMALGKHVRQERRMPSFYLMVTALIFIACCLIAVWVFSSPSDSPIIEQIEILQTDTTVSTKEKVVTESQPFEDSTDELPLEIEESISGSPKETTESKTIESSREKVKNGELVLENEGKKAFVEEKVKEQESEEGETKAGDEGQLQKEVEDVEEKKEGENGEEKKEGDKQETLMENEREKPEEKGETTKVEELPTGGEQSEIQVENKVIPGNWATQANESKEEKEKIDRKTSLDQEVKKEVEQHLVEVVSSGKTSEGKDTVEPTSYEQELQTDGKKVVQNQTEQGSIRSGVWFNWEICDPDGISAIDYIPCLDNMNAIKQLKSTKHYEHRERHCPIEPPTCLVPLPEGYRLPIPWPQSRNEVWYSNVPHSGLVSYKKDQNWVKKSGDRLVFPGGGTQFKHGALHYIDFIEQTIQDIAWGKHTRVILDVGCGVASFGGYLFDRDVITMSFAPKDEHEAQVQFALERGIPAISAVMGTKRLAFPSNVYDMVHCARCRVPWHIEGGKLLLELNRVLRPGGYFVWSATPVYWKGEEDVAIWKAMVALTAAMCWNLLARTIDPKTRVGVAIFRKPTTNFCYDRRPTNKEPAICEDDNPDAAWYIPMITCLHRLPSEDGARGIEWPVDWPQRLETAPSWLSNEKGLYGKPAAADFQSDTEHWQRVVERSYLRGLGIDWSRIRNVMDMRAIYGGFAAALATQPVWVINVVPKDAPDTLPIIFDRGLLGIYHDWCESFSTYPRTYDILHADHLFSRLKKSCKILPTIVEMDRILRPEGWAIFRDKVDIISEIEAIITSLHWEIRLTYSKEQEGLLAAQKKMWRPEANA